MIMPNVEQDPKGPRKFTRGQLLRTAARLGEAAVISKALKPFSTAFAEDAPPLPDLGPDEGVVKSFLAKSFYSPENPGQFKNETKEFALFSIPDGNFLVNGDVNLDLSFNIADPNGFKEASGIILDFNGKTGPELRKVFVVYQNGSFKLGVRDGGSDWALFQDIKKSENPSGDFSLKISGDGKTIVIGEEESKSFTLNKSLYDNGNQIQLKTQIAPNANIALNIVASGEIDLPAPAPTPTPTPDQQPPVVENRFQFPDFSHPIEAKIGDLETDGFEIINMGKTKGIFVTDMDYARAAIQKHFGESGKKLRIIMYDKSSDIPKNLNVTAPGLVRAFPRSGYQDSVEIGNLYENYGRPVEDENGVITLHFAVNNDLSTTVPAYSKLAGNHNVYLQEVVSRLISLWVTGLMRLYSKYIPPIKMNRPSEESGFEEELTFFSKPIIIATQNK